MRIIGELGAPRTLPGGAEQFRELYRPETGEKAGLVLGLGPDPGILARELGLAGGINYYMESPDFLAQAGKGLLGGLSRSWMHRDPRWLMGLGREELLRLRILQYLPGQRVFPSYWGPILGRVRALLAGAVPGQAIKRRVLLPGEAGGLLVRELAHAFAEAGWDVGRLELARGRHPDPAMLAEKLARRPAALYFSVNFQGLDPHGEVYHTLTQAGCSVAAWCVDNPWHLVSALKAGFWRDMDLFVTDHLLRDDLETHGAKRAHHLPLAASPALFQPGVAREQDLAGQVVFVGRSEFPGKAGFFAGLRVEPSLMAEALGLLDAGLRPDFFWWVERLELGERWPSKAVRLAGLGAEESGLAHRARCLNAVAKSMALTVFGDAGWSKILDPGIPVRPPVDYYGALPRVYASAGSCLNMTSLLLPGGLTQRHFDVWLAGGLLLTDATPGLAVFPQELVEPVVFTRPGEIGAKGSRLAAMADKARDLRVAWQECILAEHTYAHRAREVLRVLGLDRTGT